MNLREFLMTQVYQTIKQKTTMKKEPLNILLNL